MNNLQNVLSNTGDTDMTIETIKSMKSKDVNIHEAIFGVIMAAVSCVSIWCAVCLVISFIDRIN